MCRGLDCWAHCAPILKTITYDGDSYHVRDVRKDENAETIWDSMVSDESSFQFITPDGDVSQEVPKYLMYTEADALEDGVLFPEETSGSSARKRYRGVENRLTKFESGSLRKFAVDFFVRDGDTDDEDSYDSGQDLLDWESDDDSKSSDEGTDTDRAVKDSTSLTAAKSTSSNSKILEGLGQLAMMAHSQK